MCTTSKIGPYKPPMNNPPPHMLMPPHDLGVKDGGVTVSQQLSV